MDYYLKRFRKHENEPNKEIEKTKSQTLLSVFSFSRRMTAVSFKK